MNILKTSLRFAHSEGVTDVCFSSDGKYLITCGIDGDVRQWAGFNDDDPTSHCAGEKAYAVAQCDSNVYVATDSNNVQKFAISDWKKGGIVMSFTAPVLHIAISPDGSKIVAGSWDMNVKVQDRQTSNVSTLVGHNGAVVSVSIDPELKYVTSSSLDGTIRVWSLDPLECVKVWNYMPVSNSFTGAECLGRTSWFPQSGRYIAVPNQKTISVYHKETWELLQNYENDIDKIFSIASFSPCGKYIAGSTIGGDISLWKVGADTSFYCTEHYRSIPICSLAWNPIDSGILAYCDTRGHLGTIEQIASVSDLNAEQERLSADSDDNDYENATPLDELPTVVPQIIRTPQLIDEADQDKVSDSDSVSSLAGDEKLNIQRPFQPTATPVHLQHRYMVWNSIGIVRCHNTEEEHVIEVQFHDSNLHHKMNIRNFAKNTLASLSAQLLTLASEVQEETPSVIRCILTNSWDGMREWTVELPDSEEVLGLACTNNWAVAATDKRNLRLFTALGTQREVMTIAGPVVCLAAHDETLLVIFYHGSGLSYMLLSVLTNCVKQLVSKEPVSVTPQTSLQWAGFSDEGTPCTMDSSGCVRILSSNGHWIPICETQDHCKGKSDHHFILGLSERLQNIRCVLCKGSHYPATVPLPTIIELPLKLPLCEPSSEKSGWEEKLQRTQIFLGLQDGRKIDELDHTQIQDAERTITEALLKLFALACRCNLEQRACELCKMMSPQQAQLALRYATKLGKAQLVKRVTEIADQKKGALVPYQHEKPGSSRSEKSSGNKIPLQRKVLALEAKKPVEEPDPFAPSQEVKKGKETILETAKVKIATITESPSGTLKRENPFKKTTKQNENADASNMQHKKDAGNAKPVQQGSSTKTRQSGLWGMVTPQPPKPRSFVDWFDKEKPKLQAEHSDLSVSELTRLAMKRFREIMMKEKLAASALLPVMADRDSSTSNNEGASKKRKMENETSAGDKASVASKLTKFVYKK